MAFKDDVQAARAALADLPSDWDGRESILALKAANYNWKQMEWLGWFFEWIGREQLRKAGFEVPGDRIGSVSFDARRSGNWDLKAHAIKSHTHTAILNDVAATDKSIELYSFYGAIVAMCDVEYNDDTRVFQAWHSELKGGRSKYEEKILARNAVSRYRKTHASLREILFIRIDRALADRLPQMRQGQNSNGKPRPPKYMIDLEKVPARHIERCSFPRLGP